MGHTGQGPGEQGPSGRSACGRAEVGRGEGARQGFQPGCEALSPEKAGEGCSISRFRHKLPLLVHLGPGRPPAVTEPTSESPTAATCENPGEFQTPGLGPHTGPIRQALWVGGPRAGPPLVS